MADDGAPMVLQRPVKLSRVWFLSPGEPRDFQTFRKLVEAAIGEIRDEIVTDARAAHLLALIGRKGKERHTRALEAHIQTLIARRLVQVKERQPIRHALVDLRIVPLPKSGRLEGVLIVSAWRHWLRTTLPLTIAPGT
jgi:hypothetical protein